MIRAEACELEGVDELTAGVADLLVDVLNRLRNLVDDPVCRGARRTGARAALDPKSRQEADQAENCGDEQTAEGEINHSDKEELDYRVCHLSPPIPAYFALMFRMRSCSWAYLVG